MEPLETFFEELGFWEYAADKPVSSVIGHDYCDYDDFPDNEEFCLSLSDAVFALSPGQLNVTMLPWYFDFKAEGASVKTVLHYGQVVNRTGHFPRYDLGREGNLEAYGQASPPDYDLGSIGVPTYLYWGDSDALATPTDVQKLAEVSEGGGTLVMAVISIRLPYVLLICSRSCRTCVPSTRFLWKGETCAPVRV